MCTLDILEILWYTRIQWNRISYFPEPPLRSEMTWKSSTPSIRESVLPDHVYVAAVIDHLNLANCSGRHWCIRVIHMLQSDAGACGITLPQGSELSFIRKLHRFHPPRSVRFWQHHALPSALPPSVHAPHRCGMRCVRKAES